MLIIARFIPNKTRNVHFELNLVTFIACKLKKIYRWVKFDQLLELCISNSSADTDTASAATFTTIW